jgi:hypothetical protein
VLSARESKARARYLRHRRANQRGVREYTFPVRRRGQPLHQSSR